LKENNLKHRYSIGERNLGSAKAAMDLDTTTRGDLEPGYVMQ